MLTGADQLPPAGRVAVWIRWLWIRPPLNTAPAQTAVALPWESTATYGQAARTPVAESVTGADQIPPDERVEPSIAPLCSSSQTAVAPPWGSSAMCGDRAAFLGGDRATGADQLPPADRVALWTTERQPSSRSKSQTAVTLPSGPAATSAEPAPAAERVTGADQLSLRPSGSRSGRPRRDPHGAPRWPSRCPGDRRRSAIHRHLPNRQRKGMEWTKVRRLAAPRSRR